MLNQPKPEINLDADHQGHLLCVLTEVHTKFLYDMDQVLARLEDMDEGTRREYLDTLYILGNIEGRLLHNHINEDDLELIEMWEAELAEGLI